MVPDKIVELVERFERNKASYIHSSYKENQLRPEFVNPFFEALGWDVQNKSGKAEAYKDVIHEDALKIGKSMKAPDYSFRIGGQRKFFVETKKPSIDIKTKEAPAYQIRRYSWSAKLPLAILTDFEEFAVYDCRTKPLPTDSPSVGRILYVKYNEYTEKWAEIEKFSKNAIEQGLFDEYAESMKGKRGTTEVDVVFLKEIERWRDLLAKNIASRNPGLSVREINFAVQKTVDRLIFLRICEDRGIESYGQLQELAGKEKVHDKLLEIYERADDKYNSGIFHFKDEKGRTGFPDLLTPALRIDDKVFKDIIKNLYYPDCPYEFSVIGADILGNVYEQFLGKVIRLTAGHRAVVEEKPEVKKAGGVYYTPKYIVDYIVENTVSKLIEGKTPKQITSLKILDPACGSGSFLIGAYQKLLDYHRDWYVEHNPEKHTKEIYQGASGQWYLTLDEKKKILLNNIYGVDIDEQAVEVAKLNLLLKVLEDEHREAQKRLGGRVLPNLDQNIKCGNSLIGPDFYSEQTKIFTEEETLQLNTFDWNKEFPFKFDAVIGNPPYRMLQPHNTDKSILSFYRTQYVAAKFKIELFNLFIQRGVTLLNGEGLLGYIVPSSILNNVHSEALRKWLMEYCCIDRISVANEKVFKNADVHTSVLIFKRELNEKKRLKHKISTTSKLNNNILDKQREYSVTLQNKFMKLPGCVWNILINENNASLVLRLLNNFPSLGEVSTINRGLITGARDKYFSKERKTESYIPIIAGKDVHRYQIIPPSEYVLFERPDNAGGCWDPEVHLAAHKLVIRQICRKPTVSILNDPIGVTGNIFTSRMNSIEQELYALGLINSRLIEFFWKIMFTDFKSSFPQVTIFSLSQLPIRLIDFSYKEDQINQNRMISLVSRMLDLHKRLDEVNTPQEKSVLERQIEATDNEINQLVYDLYELTDEEIKIVEQST